MYMNNNDIFSIYMQWIPFDNGHGGKTRPVVIVGIKSRRRVAVMKITSKYWNKGGRIRKVYYPLKDCKTAHVRVPSYVDTHRIYIIQNYDMTKAFRIGRLSARDDEGLMEHVKALMILNRNKRSANSYSKVSRYCTYVTSWLPPTYEWIHYHASKMCREYDNHIINRSRKIPVDL